MEVLGGVAVFAPADPGGYFRLRWTSLDGRRADTSGGRDLDAARAKAADIAAGLARAAGPQATATLGELFTRYLGEGRSPYTGRPWKRSTRIQIEDNLGRALRGHAHVAAMDVTREVLDRMRAEAGTPHMVRINTTALRAFLLWGYRHSPSFFTITQAELLPSRVVMPAPAVKGTQAPTRRTRARRVGQQMSMSTRKTPLPPPRCGRSPSRSSGSWGLGAPWRRSSRRTAGLAGGSSSSCAPPTSIPTGARRPNSPTCTSTGPSTCTALLPLASSGHAQLPLAGRISNVRTRTGRNLANTDTVVRYLFEEGRELTATAELLQVTRATLLKKRVMPWLVANGITSRGAKCALVDHPISEVRQELHRWVTRAADDNTKSPTSAYAERLRSTYTDPNLSWGDAAVPDDTAWASDAIALLTVDTATRRHGLPILDVALALGKTEDEIRELVKPQRRSGGFTRPVYLVYANQARTHVKAVPCPHGRCRGRRFADHVSLLPEVAASGYGVICSHCRRTPAEDGTWPVTQYPSTYLERWTSAGGSGSLREAPRTIRSLR